MLRTSTKTVLVLGPPGDVVASEVADQLRGRFELRREDVDGPEQLRERVAALGHELGALVVAAGDASAAATLVWDLDLAPAPLRARAVVVVDEATKLDAVPTRLLTALTYVGLDALEAGALAKLVSERLRRPGGVDALASLVRSAIERRSLDSLPPLLGDWGRADDIDPVHLRLAHRDDGGRGANPLWAAWVRVREAAALERLEARLEAHAGGEAGHDPAD